MYIVHLFDLIETAILMFEKTALSVGTEEPLIEGCASLRFVLVVVDRRCFTHQFMLTMSKLAFCSIPTQPDFNPIFAHLSLILGFVYF